MKRNKLNNEMIYFYYFKKEILIQNLYDIN